MNTISRFLLLLLILFVGFIAIAFYWTFYKPLPVYEGEITLTGLQSDVDVHWDKDGVPHIYAGNQHDLYMTLGYVHAQDRLWQMTLSQMVAEGRLSEFLGKDLLQYDKFQRTLGIWDVAKKIEQSLHDSTLSVLKAYSKGVNAYISDNKKKLPIEFSLTDMKPIPWTVTHSIALSRMMGWNLNVSWWTEVLFGHLQQKLTEKQFSHLTGAFESYPITSLDDFQSAELTSSLMDVLETEFAKRKLLQISGSHVGSNAWVADGSKTQSDFPLLAGDPHLGLNMPGTWYEVHLNLNGRNLSGATLAGAPVVILGQNDFLAWSLTNIMADDTDFFVEKINPADRGEYVVDSLEGKAVYRDFDISREIIKTREGGEELLQIRRTKHGPVISDIYQNDSLIDDRVITLQWTGHQVSHEFDALLKINWASSFSGFKKALPHFKVPGQNFMYADVTGNIAMYSAAAIPVRSYNPLLPREGWDPSYDWQGYIPFEELPRVVNPDKGFIANANNKLATDAYPHYLATFWEPPSRIRRIQQILSDKDSLTVEDFKQLQTDTFSYHAKTVTEIILPVLRNANKNGLFDIPIAYLENWNYIYDPNAAAASIMDVFFMKLTENTLLDEIGKRAYQNFIHMENVPVRTMHYLLQQDTASVLFDDIETDNTVESREEIIVRSMRQSVEYLVQNFGEESFQWRWEQLHTVTLKPPLFSQAAEKADASQMLKLLVNNLLSIGPLPVGGHGLSVNSTEYNWSNPYQVVHGPSIRRIVDFSDLSRSYSILPTGQSGRPLSEHYGDQFQSWVQGNYKFLYQDSTMFHRAYLQTVAIKAGNKHAK